MKTSNQNKIISSQFILALIIFFGVSSKVQAAQNKVTYKAEQCDCLGFSDDIPTFLSDLTKQPPTVYGEGSSQTAAAEQARNMCIETYRSYASNDKQNTQSVTESGCHFFKSTGHGDWEAL